MKACLEINYIENCKLLACKFTNFLTCEEICQSYLHF